jgi:hypothetical protein
MASRKVVTAEERSIRDIGVERVFVEKSINIFVAISE